MIARLTKPFAVVLLLLYSGPAHAAATRPPQPVNIESDQMEILDAEKKATFRGNVDATRGDVNLKANELTVTYAEVKQARLGRGTKMGHFSYVGDADVGQNVNIGAGTITCNFDGVNKNRTVIEDHAFIGSDTLLVAPVRIGARSVTGAGAVVTKDVPSDSLAAGIPARVQRRSKAPEQTP